MTTRRQMEAQERVRKRRMNAAAHQARQEREDERLLDDIAAGRCVPEPTRITCALDLRCLHGPQVDADLGVLTILDGQAGDPDVVDRWEAGTLIPTLDEIKRLAALTDFPWQFFYGPPLPELGPVCICGRR